MAREDVASSVIADIGAGMVEVEGGGNQGEVDGDVGGEHGEFKVTTHQMVPKILTFLTNFAKKS